MQEPRNRFLFRLGQALRERDEDLANAPLPRRWVDLIVHLNEREMAEGDTSRQSTQHDAARRKNRLYGT
jgi:hypothetical protein